MQEPKQEQARPITLGDSDDRNRRPLGSHGRPEQSGSKTYHRRLDEAASKYDQGPYSADVELIGGDAGLAQAAVRKALAARSLAVAQGYPGVSTPAFSPI